MTKITIDPHLKAALEAFSESWAEKRSACFEGEDFEKLRERLTKRKDFAVANTDALLIRFEEQAVRHGSRVLRADDGDTANRMILEILREHGAGSVVKTKSMVSEETALNSYLSRSGIEAKETDLGEWILQLAEEAPTHMVMPAIHLTRRGVARIFAERLGRHVDDDIPGLVGIARKELRNAILEAPAGLTGANALIAENGAMMLVTNEGNGRLVTSVPPVHIVLASTEKILETTADALLLLRLLTKNATGQAVSSYISLIAGPHRKAQYIILLDNHRGELRADAHFRSVLRCIKCSACLNVCPVYRAVGGAAFSHVYMGGIGSLLTAWIHGLEESRRLTDLCAGCHHCEAVCSTKIPIADLVRALRARQTSKKGKAVWKRLVLDGVMTRPTLQKGLFSAGRALGPVIRKKEFLRSLPLWMKRYDRFRALPAPAKKPFSRLYREAGEDWNRERKTSKGEIVLFTGCLIEHFYPEVGLAAARVLTGLGYVLQIIPAACCGFPHLNAGHLSSAVKARRRVLKMCKSERPIITLCPTCTSMLARPEPSLRHAISDPNELSLRVLPFSQFLNRNERDALDSLKPEEKSSLRAAYHESCHHRFVLGASALSRELVQTVLGRELIELSRQSSCCGFAGTYSVDHPEVAAALLEDTLAAVEAAEADLVVLDCPGCLLQIRGGLDRKRRRTIVKHTAEILDEAAKNRNSLKTT